jgi:hypothetical protein
MSPSAGEECESFGVPLGFSDVVEHSPFGDAPFRWRMGVRGLAEDLWLQPDDLREADLAEKAALIARDPDQVMRQLPVADAAASELLGLITDDLARRSLPPPPTAGVAIERAGRAVQEDLCVMQPVNGVWSMVAGSVCFPTRWSLADKIGKSLAAIHAPVPNYATDLGPQVERFFDRMTAGSLAYRLNWSLVGQPDRRLPAMARQAPTDLPEDPRQDLFVRIERQTLRRLTGTNAIVFGIRIHVWPLGDVVDDVVAAGFIHELQEIPFDVARYKNLDGMRPQMIAWLGG